MRSAGCPLHLLLFYHALADHLVDRGFNEGRADHLAVSVAFAKVRDELLIVADVGFEFTYTLGHLLRQWRGNLGKKLKHLLEEVASSSLRRKSTTLLPAITSKKPCLWVARTKPPSMPTVIGPSGGGCASQSCSGPSKNTGFSSPRSASIRSAV